MHLSTTSTISLITALLAPLALSAHLRIAIPPSPLLPNPSTLAPSTSATLSTLSAVHRGPLRVDNAFEFRNVSAGSYLLDIHSHSHAFAPLRVDVSGTGAGDGNGVGEKVQVWGTFRGNEWGNKGEEYAVRKVGGVWVWEVRVIAEKEYFFERSGFSPLSLLKNPMILIAGVSMIIVFGMPYLMDSMDPEMRAEFEERQKSTSITSGTAANPLQNFDAAAWLAGSGPKRSDTPVEKGITR